MDLLHPHHDGSPLYVSDIEPAIGDSVQLRVRVPAAFKPEKIFVRFFHDGEPRTKELKKYKTNKVESWWRVSVEVLNPTFHYRFMLVGKDGFTWLNGMGIFDHDVTDREDFQIVANAAHPRWIQKAVFYQIFPDRFSSSGTVRDVPAWAVPKQWNELPKGRDRTTGQEFYGGDFPGITERLPYIKDLGVSAIYFTPAFPARSTHRYDASSFDEVDPLLGGNQGLIDFARAAHKAGLRIMGDLTTNHCGAGHPWIQKALKNKKAREREFFFWDSAIKHGYVGWWGLASLPKLNYESQRLRDLMYSGENSVVKKWLREPFSMDGWRIDVGNMTGRYLGQDINQEIARGIRKSVYETQPDAWLVAENADHSPSDLDGFGWHGTMNYNGFARPLVNWFNAPDNKLGNFSGLPGRNPKFGGVGTVSILRSFAAGIPWRSLVASMLLLDSHDTARFRTVVNGDVNTHLAAAAMLLTYPGVPSIFAGDEIGLEGAWGEDARRTIDWDAPEKWNHSLLEGFKTLIAMRRTHDALSDGGLRWIHASDDSIAYLRESKRETILVYISRSGTSSTIDLAPYGYKVSKTLYGQPQSGKMIKVKSKSATAGIWVLK
jgi:alpha-glucosidase